MPSDTPKHDLTPTKNPKADKKMGEHFDDAMNPPNDPKKRYQPTHWNTTDDYPTYGSEGNES